MKLSFGPWSTAMNTGNNPQLSTFWKRRMTMLPFLKPSQQSPSKQTAVGFVVMAGLLLAIPLLRAEDSTGGKPVSEDSADNASGKILTAKTQKQKSKTYSKKELQKKWKALSKKEAAEITRRHIHGLMRAAHLYHEAHGTLPPAVIPNPKLPAGKRLSGLVLLLPYLGADSYLEKDKKSFDEQTVNQAKELYEKIDLTKAWDAPVNLKAAKTIIPAFLAPQSSSFRDKNGFAVSHFAFVQGCDGKENGAFPGEKGIKLSEITDGTVVTLGLGQISESLGPWMAEGFSTSRQLVHPPDGETPTFGGPYTEGCYFTTCDSYAFFLLLQKTPQSVLNYLTNRSDQQVIEKDQIQRQKLPPGVEEKPAKKKK